MGGLQDGRQGLVPSIHRPAWCGDDLPLTFCCSCLPRVRRFAKFATRRCLPPGSRAACCNASRQQSVTFSHWAMLPGRQVAFLRILSRAPSGGLARFVRDAHRSARQHCFCVFVLIMFREWGWCGSRRRNVSTRMDNVYPASEAQFANSTHEPATRTSTQGGWSYGSRGRSWKSFALKHSRSWSCARRQARNIWGDSARRHPQRRFRRSSQYVDSVASTPSGRLKQMRRCKLQEAANDHGNGNPNDAHDDNATTSSTTKHNTCT